jgi:Tfp pilus assembly protein FimT
MSHLRQQYIRSEQCGRPDRGRAHDVVAFTLAELLIVLVMIAVLSCTLAVNLTGRQDRQALLAAAKDLAAAIRYSAQQAHLRRAVHRLAFYDSFTTFRVEVCATDEAEGFVPVVGLAGKRRRMPEAVQVKGVVVDEREMSELPEALVFDPGGKMFCGTIQLADRKGQVVAIETTGGATQVRIVEGAPPR